MKVKFKNIILISVLYLCFVFNVSNAWAQNPVSLDLNQAIQMALESNKTYKSSLLEIEKAWENREDAVGQIKFFTDDRWASKDAIAKLTTFYISDNAWLSARHSAEMQKDVIVNETARAYWEVKKSEYVLAKYIKQEKIDTKVVQDTTLLKKVGLVDNLKLIAAEAQLSQTRENIENAKKTLEDNKQKLKKLLNVSDSTEIQLISEPKITDISKLDLKQLITKAKERSPGLKLAKDQLNLAREQKNFTTPYQVGAKTEEQKELSLMQSEQDLESNVKSIYYGLLQIANKTKQTQDSIRVASESLRIAKIKHQVGLITDQELLKIENELNTIEQGQKELKCIFEQQYFSLKVLTGLE